MSISADQPHVVTLRLLFRVHKQVAETFRSVVVVHRSTHVVDASQFTIIFDQKHSKNFSQWLKEPTTSSSIQKIESTSEVWERMESKRDERWRWVMMKQECARNDFRCQVVDEKINFSRFPIEFTWTAKALDETKRNWVVVCWERNLAETFPTFVACLRA